MSTTYSEGGPGRKKCECGIFVAARTGTCPKCGHVFVSRVAEPPARRSAPAQISPEEESGRAERNPGNVVLAPSGKCPVELRGSDLGAVQEWASLLQGAMPGQTVSRSCALQFLRQFFPWGSAEFQEARSHLPHCRALYADSEFHA